MPKFFLVIDTETSGIPKNWRLPYSDDKNWPHIVQIAWIVYDENFTEVKRENHYLKDDNFSISKTSIEIHKITHEFLQVNGEDKQDVLLKFIADLSKFQPLIIGHFIEFDFHILNAEFFRIGRKDVLQNSSFFCTMKASTPYVKNPSINQLKLNQFYESLFNEEPKGFHNALDDTINTAKIFFHLITLNHSMVDEYLAKNEFRPDFTTPQVKAPNFKHFTSTFKSLFSLLWKIN